MTVNTAVSSWRIVLVVCCFVVLFLRELDQADWLPEQISKPVYSASLQLAPGQVSADVGQATQAAGLAIREKHYTN